MAWIELAHAKRYLRLPTLGSPDPQDEVLEPMLAQAEALVTGYIERPADDDWADEVAGWDEETVPPAIAAATLRLIADLWRFRGDDDDKNTVDGNDLPPRVKQLLKRYRDPALA